MSPLEPSCPTTAGLEYSYIAESQEKDFKTNCMKVVEALKEEMNKTLTGIHENANGGN